MNWKCDFCDSYNKEASKTCFVCGQERSIESIRAGKRRARIKQRVFIDLLIIQKGYRVAKILYTFGLAVAIVTTFVGVSVLLKRNGWSVTWQMIRDVGKHVYLNAAQALGGNAKQLAKDTCFVRLKHLLQNGKAVYAVIAVRVAQWFSVVFPSVLNTVKTNFREGYEGGIISILKHILE